MTQGAGKGKVVPKIGTKGSLVRKSLRNTALFSYLQHTTISTIRKMSRRPPSTQATTTTASK